MTMIEELRDLGIVANSESVPMRQFWQGVLLDGPVESRKQLRPVMPAKAGIQQCQTLLDAGSSPA